MKVFFKIYFMALATLIFSMGLSVKSYAVSCLVPKLNEFNSAIDKAQPGDTIRLKNGDWKNIELKFYTNGNKGNPIVLIAQTPGKVILSGQSRLRIYGKYLEVNGLDFGKGYSNESDVIEFRKSSNQLATNCRLTNTRILYYNSKNKRTEYNSNFLKQ